MIKSNQQQNTIGEREILKLLIEEIDYSFMQTDGNYNKALTYPVIDKVLWAKKQLANCNTIYDLP